ncbi:symporter small accessory protein [uncultured Thiodictyon sp.]|uniref:symporter small accessory protein n=1 Tax=uncultured Thiodictyon sp. TaxID=1846217 RepID=UPI0025D9E39F|nr:symporter small accessory protein [uncultured Thiodictyon sp.]
MLGIPDPMVLAAFLGCIAVTAISVIYGVVRRNAAVDEVTREDRAWAIEEKKVEDEL